MGIAVGGLVAIAVAAPRIMHTHSGESKYQIARDTVKDYAYVAYPEWAAHHPGFTCPDTLFELNHYLARASRDIKDPWGENYYYACGPLMVPKAATGLLVISPGEDGKFGTDDDVRSDR